MTGDLLFIIKITQLDARMIGDHQIPIGTIQNIFELNMWTIEGHLVLHSDMPIIQRP